MSNISVVVAAHSMERLKHIELCVDSVLEGTKKPDELIVVVDNNRELARELETRLERRAVVMESPGKGASSARNAGIARATSSIVGCIDDDAWAEPGWIEAISNAFHDEEVLAIGGKIIPEYETLEGYQLPPELLWIIGSTYRGHWESAGPISRPIGANMAFRRNVIMEVGGFSAAFGPTRAKKENSNEELALAIKIHEQFGEDAIRYCPTAVVHHFAPKDRLTWRYFIRRCWVEGKSKAAVRRQSTTVTMDHDRSYLVHTLLPAIVSYGLSGIRGKRADLHHCVRAMVAVVVTGSGYVIGRVF